MMFLSLHQALDQFIIVGGQRGQCVPAVLGRAFRFGIGRDQLMDEDGHLKYGPCGSEDGLHEATEPLRAVDVQRLRSQ